MVANRVAAQRSRARSGLLVVGGLLVGGLVLSAMFRTTGVGVPCPFLALTGWQCPFCGGTRMGSALLRGDLAAAFACNPLLLFAVAVTGALGVAWAIEFAGGPAARPPRRLADRLQRVPGVVWPFLALGLAVVYTLLRNLG